MATYSGDLSDFFKNFLGDGSTGGTTTTTTPTAPTTRYGTIIPKDAQKRIDAGEPWLADRLLLGEGDMRRLAGDIATQEESRYQEGKGLLGTAYTEARDALSKGIDPNLLFSKAADAVGARSGAALNNLRSSFGARGLSPNSGVAGGALSRLMFESDAALTGATRDIAIDNQRQRAVNAAQNFANALNLAGYTNSPVGGVMLETEQNIFEGVLAQKGIAEQRKSAKEAAASNEKAGWISGIGGLVGGAAGLLF